MSQAVKLVAAAPQRHEQTLVTMMSVPATVAVTMMMMVMAVPNPVAATIVAAARHVAACHRPERQRST
jgi:hypothetical protein